MNKTLPYLFIAVISGVAGYFSYPLLNVDVAISASSEQARPHTNGVDNTIKKDQPNASATQLQDAIKTTENQPPETLASQEPHTPVDNARDTNSRDISPNATERDKNAPLSDWQLQRRETISNQIKAHLPEKTAPIFEKHVFEGNDFLSEPAAETDYDDAQWAADMEQLLRDRIALHEKASVIQIHSVLCRNKVCDMLGTSLEMGSWQAVQISIYNYFQAQGILFHPERSKNGAFITDGNVHFYAQFVFR